MDDESLERWSALGSALVSDCLDRAAAMDGGIVRLAGERLVGPAFPIRTLAGDSRTLHLALQHVPEGAVLVVNAERYRHRAVWGEVLTVAARRRGARGLVLDGAVRDLDAVRQLPFPVFARGTSPAGPHKGGNGTIGEPISCAGVTVCRGDLVVGDRDGVVVVPVKRIEEVFLAASERRDRERRWIDRIMAGESSIDVLGLSP